MDFKEAYKRIVACKRMTKDGITVTNPEGPVPVKYLSLVYVEYKENGNVVKSEPSFIAAFDEKDGINRVTDSNLVNMLLSDEDDWKEYVEPAVEEPIEDVVKE